jgi:WD40 repeat protein
MRILEGHRGDVRAVCFTPGNRLVSGGSDRKVRLWDLTSGSCLHVLAGEDRVYAVAVDPAGETLAYAGKPKDSGQGRNTVRLWDLRRECPAGECVWPMEPARSIWSLAFSGDGAYLAAACRYLAAGGQSDGGGGYWWRRRRPQGEGAFADGSVNALTFSRTTSEIALATNAEVVVLAEPKPAPRELYHFRLAAEWAAAILLLPSAAVAAASSFLYVRKVADVKVRRIKTALKTITALALSHDGRTFLAAGRPGLVQIYDAETYQLRASYDFDVGGIHAAAYAPDGCTFALGADKGLVLCDLD